MHIKFPVEPGFPCDDPGPDGCPGAAGSEVRYWSMSFNNIAGETVYSFSREDLPVVDEVSNVATIVFSFLDTLGEPFDRPPELASRFNWVHIPSEYLGENPMDPFMIITALLRMQVGDEADIFTCSPYGIPPGFGEHCPDGVIGSYIGGGFMGDYIPQTDVMKLSTLIMYQDFITVSPDPVGGECSTTYSPYDHPDEWWSILELLSPPR